MFALSLAASRRRALAAATLAIALATSGLSSSARASGLAPLTNPAARATLTHYLTAIAAGRFDVAFRLLSSDERRYFGTAADYASIFAADRLKLERFRITGATGTPNGFVASVDEATQYYDPSHQSVDEAEGHVLYGLVPEAGGYRIKDPYHPWRVVAPEHASAVVDGITIAIAKISFFTGRFEMVVSFENRGDAAVTVLPNRTIVRDDRDTVAHALIDPGTPYTDRQLRLGLRLEPNARYTGALAFSSVDRFRPRTLELSVAPLLKDEGDRPFSVDLPAVTIPR